MFPYVIHFGLQRYEEYFKRPNIFVYFLKRYGKRPLVSG